VDSRRGFLRGGVDKVPRWEDCGALGRVEVVV